jgi:hypothetical protein
MGYLPRLAAPHGLPVQAECRFGHFTGLSAGGELRARSGARPGEKEPAVIVAAKLAGTAAGRGQVASGLVAWAERDPADVLGSQLTQRLIADAVGEWLGAPRSRNPRLLMAGASTVGSHIGSQPDLAGEPLNL